MNQEEGNDPHAAQNECSSEEDVQKFYPSQTKDQNDELTPDQILEKILMEQLDQDEINHTKQNPLSDDLLQKMDELLENIKQNQKSQFQTLITLRMKELAYSKILVLTYEKSYFRLVVASLHIGKQYLRFGCYEQAASHLENAIAKNIRAADNQNTKLYHSFILTYLAESYFFLKKYVEAEQQLTKALNIQTENEAKTESEVNNVHTLILLSRTYLELKNIKESEDTIEKAIAKTDNSKLSNTKIAAIAVYQRSLIHLETNQKQKAISYLKESIEILKKSNEANIEEDIIKSYFELADLYQSMSDRTSQIQALRDRYTVLEDTFGNSDKRCIKEQRNLALTLMKHQDYRVALEELEDVLEKEQKVYGENSTEVGKQLKNISIVCLALGKTKDAEAQLRKALKIFHDLGDQKLAREVREKIGSIKQVCK